MERSPCSSDTEDESNDVARKNVKRFTAAQQACLMKYWCNGLTSCSKQFYPHVINAAKDTGLSCD